MPKNRAREVWDKLLLILDDKLQLGALEQARSVVDVSLEGNELKLTVTTPEALEFFNSEVNVQRLMLYCRPIMTLTRVSAIFIEAEPLR